MYGLISPCRVIGAILYRCDNKWEAKHMSIADEDPGPTDSVDPGAEANDIGAEKSTSSQLYHVPATVEEMKPPRPNDLITEASNFLRSHWSECRPFWAAIAGEEPTIHGSRRFDEAGLAFEVQTIARANGFALLGDVPAAKLWTTLRFAYRRNTGISVKLLEKQNARLRIEHKLPTAEHKSAAE
jgi:hypothetical protein